MQGSGGASVPKANKGLPEGVVWAKAICNVYVLRDPEGTYIIDTGMGKDAKNVLASLSSAGVRVQDLKGILLTHQHPDHVGGAATIQKLSGAPVAAHRMDAMAIEGKAARSGAAIARVLMHPVPVKVANVLEDGSTIGPFTTIYLPGHTPGSVAFYHKARSLLFTGDALIVSHAGRLCLSRSSYTYDPEGAAMSLGKLAGLSVSAIMPGHGSPITEGATEKLAEVVEKVTHPLPSPSPTLIGPEGRPEIHPGSPGWKEGQAFKWNNTRPPRSS
jgi:glyoxylase-like metal-dependent hydrolase (beta-lactamase superfamily II)